MDINDSMEEIVKSIATIEVNSSIRLFSAVFDSRMEVITNKQIPSKFDGMLRLCSALIQSINSNVTSAVKRINMNDANIILRTESLNRPQTLR